MKILLQNGTLVLPHGQIQANLLVEDDTIAYIGSDAPQAEQIMDATGCFIMPGFIDTHTHLELSPGLFGKDTQAAALGGCTSVLEFACQRPGKTMADGLHEWLAMAQDSTVNYGFHMTLSQWTPALADEMPSQASAGITSYKMFMVYDGLRVNDGEIYQAMSAIKQAGGILGVHCENWDVLQRRCVQVFDQGISGPEGHPLSRPAPVEAEAIARFLRIAQLAEAPAYIVHLSSEEGLEEIRRARLRGQEVYVETCPQYLTLTDQCYSQDDGAVYVMSPPLRKSADCNALWAALAKGEIDTMGTDHCSFTMDSKLAHQTDFRQIPNGCAGLEHRGQLLYTYGVCTGRITLEQMSQILSKNPAQLFGIHDRGQLTEGSVADIVVWDPAYQGTITHTNHHHNCDTSVYNGLAVTGRARDVLINGKPVVAQGQLVSQGQGKFLKRVPGTHYRSVCV